MTEQEGTTDQKKIMPREETDEIVIIKMGNLNITGIEQNNTKIGNR
jgi:hypothetical protein